jgi:YidC/Oxa1 family membrane protein insertase
MESNSSDTKRAIIAVILSGIVLFGWQYFYGTNQPYDTGAVANKAVELNDKGIATVKSVEDTSTSSTENLVKSTNNIVENVTLKFEKSFYTLNNSLEVVEAKTKNTNTNFPSIFDLKSNEILFNFNGKYVKPFFNFTQISENEFSISDSNLSITGKVLLDEKGFLRYDFDSDKAFKVKFTMATVESEGGSAFDYTNIKQFMYLSEDFNTVAVGDDEEGDFKINWFGIDYDYHIFSILPAEATQILYKSSENGSIQFRTASPSTNFSFSQIFTKKEYDHLVDLGSNLSLAVDFGMWKIIALPILRGLQFFYTLFPNYGVSIILLTILIRTLTFPLQYKSFKSMKKMQTIQPELKELKEKFKDDPQRQQKETMALFKKAGANPLGGCLPMLLQMPVFFAFYKVLYSAVELVDAPFIFWITDLSVMDHFYVLPVLMSVAMFLNTKLTPTTSVDPAQQKIMLFMPLIFGFMMKDLPAGLTLYIFISTMMGMLQQLFVYKRTA